MLVAGEVTNKNLSTWLRAAAAAVHQSSESERGRERENERGGMQNIPTEGGLQLMQRRRKKKERTRTGLTLGRFFSKFLFSSFSFANFE